MKIDFQVNTLLLLWLYFLYWLIWVFLISKNDLEKEQSPHFAAKVTAMFSFLELPNAITRNPPRTTKVIAMICKLAAYHMQVANLLNSKCDTSRIMQE